ncbi:hypothetical protein SDC9_89346 [bioreactor metagenome]|uniref:Uncharacterized protein n=1 Tax=bioreactor metagenome TaxID=1076179 RepID=A0A644ZPK1_9ZZZZ
MGNRFHRQLAQPLRQAARLRQREHLTNLPRRESVDAGQLQQIRLRGKGQHLAPGEALPEQPLLADGQAGQIQLKQAQGGVVAQPQRLQPAETEEGKGPGKLPQQPLGRVGPLRLGQLLKIEVDQRGYGPGHITVA